MYDTPKHQYLMLSKRPELSSAMYFRCRQGPQPDSLWYGTSASTQDEFDVRVGNLLTMTTKRTVVSLEPMMGPVDMSEFISLLDWVIVGGISPGRPLHETHKPWLRSIIEQCKEHGVPLLYKHSGSELPCVDGVRYEGNPLRKDKEDGS
jgi:protein gp37